MPELPELEVIREVLERQVVGARVKRLEVVRPLVLRCLAAGDPAELLSGRRVEAVSRRGKFLLLRLEGELELAINPMLVGRLQLAAAGERRPAKTQLVLHLSIGRELRYADRRTMGRLYLTRDRTSIPGFTEMGPEALEVSAEEFRRRLRRHPGEIKNILTNPRFVAGIGNAYADEILHRARLSPFRKRPSLSAEEVAALHAAVREVLTEAIERVRLEMEEDITLKPRDWLSVHLKGGQTCPVCGTAISQIRANQRVTSYCRTCQPGTLVESWRVRRS